MFVVTGGSSGIGRALAFELAKRGKDVLVVGRRRQELAETAAFSAHIHPCVADVTSEAGRSAILAALGPDQQLQGLVHNAGVLEPIMPITAIDAQSWQQVMATNVNAPLFLTQELLHRLQQGRVLNIGSGAAYFPVMGWSAYCVSKAALSMLTRCWQLESEKTAFASVMPGIIDTNMQTLIRHAECMDAQKRDFFKELHRSNRLVSTATVALFLTWLLLDIDKDSFTSQEWDIYDTSHHEQWLVPPHVVPSFED